MAGNTASQTDMSGPMLSEVTGADSETDATSETLLTDTPSSGSELSSSQGLEFASSEPSSWSTDAETSGGASTNSSTAAATTTTTAVTEFPNTTSSDRPIAKTSIDVSSETRSVTQESAGITSPRDLSSIETVRPTDNSTQVLTTDTEGVALSTGTEFSNTASSDTPTAETSIDVSSETRSVTQESAGITSPSHAAQHTSDGVATSRPTTIQTDLMTSQRYTTDVTTESATTRVTPPVSRSTDPVEPTTRMIQTSEKDVLTSRVPSTGRPTHQATSTRDYTSSGDVTTVGKEDGGGDSTLAIALGVTCGVIAVVIIVIVVVYLIRRRRGRKHHSNEDNVQDYEVDYKPTSKKTKKTFRLANLTLKPQRTTEEPTANDRPQEKPATNQNYFLQQEDLAGVNGVSNPSYGGRDGLWAGDPQSPGDAGPWARQSDVEDNVSPEVKMRQPQSLKNLQDNRISMGPIFLDSEDTPSSQKTYDTMYNSHNTFK